MHEIPQRIFVTSCAEARWRGHSQVSLDHLGFVAAHDPLCAAALSLAGVDLDTVREEVGVRLAMRRHAARAASSSALLPTMGWVRASQTLEDRDPSRPARETAMQDGDVALMLLDELLRRPRCAFASAVATQAVSRERLARVGPADVRRAAIAGCRSPSGRPIAPGYVRISLSVTSRTGAVLERMAIADALVAALSTSPTDGHRLTESLRLCGELTTEPIPMKGAWEALHPLIVAAQHLSLQMTQRFEVPTANP